MISEVRRDRVKMPGNARVRTPSLALSMATWRRACTSCLVFLLLITLNLELAGKAASAGESSEQLSRAKAYLQDLGNTSIALIADGEKSYRQKKIEIEDLLKEQVDFDLVSKYVLGQYWKRVPRRQRNEYHDLFRTLEVSTLSRKLLGTPVESFKITGAEQQGRRDILIHTAIYPAETEPLVPAWRLRETKDGFKIVDVHYDGVSLATIRRKEFAAILNKGGFESLMDRLRQKLTAAQSE